MSSYPDDRYDDGRDRLDGSGLDGRTLERGRAAVRAPGTFLVISGLFGLLICAVASIPLVFDQDLIIRFMKAIVEGQPAGQQKQKMEQQIQDAENQINQNRDELAAERAVELGVMAAMNALAIFGGIAMRGMGSYALSMAGAVVSLIPCIVGCCTLTGIPAGIWALVVLVRPEVKAAFAARRYGPPPNPDDQYLR